MLNCSFIWTPCTKFSSFYLRHSPPVSHLCLQMCDFCRQAVDLVLRPENIAEVHFVAVEALVGPRGPWQERGRGGSGWGSSADRQHSGTDGGRLSRVLQLLDFFLESTLPSFQVTDLHLGKQKQTWGPIFLSQLRWDSDPDSVLTNLAVAFYSTTSETGLLFVSIHSWKAVFFLLFDETLTDYCAFVFWMIV